MKIIDYSENYFDEFVAIIDEFNDCIVDVDTKGLVKSFSSRDDKLAYANQMILDAAEKDGFIYLAIDNERVIGFAMGVIKDNKDDLMYQLCHIPFLDGWIGELYVKPEYRGQGIGKQLVAKANEYFQSKGCRFSRLYVLADNVDSIEVYKKLGFEVRDLEMAKEL